MSYLMTWPTKPIPVIFSIRTDASVQREGGLDRLWRMADFAACLTKSIQTCIQAKTSRDFTSATRRKSSGTQYDNMSMRELKLLVGKLAEMIDESQCMVANLEEKIDR